MTIFSLHAIILKQYSVICYFAYSPLDYLLSKFASCCYLLQLLQKFAVYFDYLLLNYYVFFFFLKKFVKLLESDKN